MEQPREPVFYKDEDISAFAIGRKNGELYAIGRNNAPRSVDEALKRIEKMLIQIQNQLCVLGGQVLSQQRSEENSADLRAE